ncbi:MAG: DNA adenine methylase [Vicinamibacterales bacterium]
MSEARPILKWAGGKRQLLPALREFYPPAFKIYFEPFLGSAAVFLDLHNRRMLGRGARLSDCSADLIGCYIAVRDAVEEVIAELERLAEEHRDRGSAHYYEVRNRRFNPMRRELAGQPSAPYPPELAAMLIYLNRTGYNGLFRLNARGDFNVPAGRYERPVICDSVNLRSVSSALRQPGVQIEIARFDAALACARPGDFVYLDPPYAPTSRTSSFTAYTAGGFAAADQDRLQALVVELARGGCRMLLSNSTAPAIKRLYADNRRVRAAGLRALAVPARRAINSRASRRGPVMEFVITNIV